MRILMSAYACCPGRGSEPGVGWNWALQAARFHEVWVLTREKNRNAIEAARPENLHPVYLDLPRWAKFWKQRKWAIWPYYHLWQSAAGRIARHLHRELRFDLAHHATFMSLQPGFVASLGVPSIVGPAGGLQQLPRGFEQIAGHRLYERARALFIRRLVRSRTWRVFAGKVDRFIIANRACLDVLSMNVRRKATVMQIGANILPG